MFFMGICVSTRGRVFLVPCPLWLVSLVSCPFRLVGYLWSSVFPEGWAGYLGVGY